MILTSSSSLPFINPKQTASGRGYKILEISSFIPHERILEISLVSPPPDPFSHSISFMLPFRNAKSSLHPTLYRALSSLFQDRSEQLTSSLIDSKI
ncbi:hypothetical protein NC653_038150 [Populus alba x Populus x berolinensis]|uniref:Uncharacterized protein n=1 Tax=Populus alba x Populus x berolinensis TaxID=444605 RepID=A0AAD6LG51_9ROSI|nr:hypothetical protein NC653_038150 [Populus alba x Populus x berolinensis]